nr:hypothetical protein [uncultured Dysosmobacter sp.]
MEQLRRWEIVSGGISLLGALLFGIQVWLHEVLTGLAVLGLGGFFAGSLLAVVKVRCPFCNHFLGLFGPVGKFCPYCGDQIKK